MLKNRISTIIQSPKLQWYPCWSVMIVKLLTTAVVLTVVYLHWSEPSCLQHKYRHTGWNLAKWILTWSGKYKNCSKYKDSGQWFLHLNLAFWTVFFSSSSTLVSSSRCDPPPTVQGLTVKGLPENCIPIRPNHILTFSCDGPGKYLNGISVLMCGEDGQWNNPFPTCIGMNMFKSLYWQNAMPV